MVSFLFFVTVYIVKYAIVATTTNRHAQWPNFLLGYPILRWHLVMGQIDSRTSHQKLCFLNIVILVPLFFKDRVIPA